MILLKDSSLCSGCSACMSSCPKNAISMLSDIQGFLVPYIDNSLCVNCGICHSVCPLENSVPERGDVCNAYGAYYKNDDIRKKSASGAFFQAIARYIIDNEGYVCGCVLENMKARHKVSNNLEDIYRMADSKYVQSDMGDCFLQIQEVLKTDKIVLFSGCSCQVAGLQKYLSLRKVNTENLYTIDFFCHGVPSPKIFSDFISFYKKKRHIKINDFHFRSKECGWGKSIARGANYLNSVNSDNLHKRKFSEKFSFFSKMWTRIFFSNLTLRKHCFTCPYAKLKKPADFTMGDFWGIENSSIADFNDGKGCSVVITQSKRANEFLKKISNLATKSVPIEEAIEKQANSFAPCIKPENYDSFWNFYNEHGFEKCSVKYFGYNLKGRFKFIVKRILFDLHLGRI